MTVRTRVAPSPTGAPHIGTAYMALFNYAFAKSRGGTFLLRIEDTDRARSTQASEQAIIDALRWMGLPWDEGPDVGGPYGPYRQSERSELYREHVERLVLEGKAYPCFCTPERLAEVRGRQQAEGSDFFGYDGHCADLSSEDARRRIDAGERYVVRLRVPREGESRVQDVLRGEVRIPWNTIDDQILLKADGFPTYHLANVVDDHLMKISHVIRGEEWISSTPKHALLYEAFGWTPPAFAHLPLLRNPDRSKLSKRKNPTSILYYRQAGYLPEALRNFMGLIAYSLPDGREEFGLEDMVASFDLGRITLGGPVFDVEKLRDFNGRYIRAMSVDELYDRLHAWRLNEETVKRILPLAQPRLEQLTDFVPMAAFLFDDDVGCDPQALVSAAGDGIEAVRLLRTAQWELEGLETWTVEGLKGLFGRMSEVEGLKLKKLMPLFFLAFSAAKVSLPVFDSLVVMGKDMALQRIQHALAKLEGAGHSMGRKKLKSLAKDYQARYG